MRSIIFSKKTYIPTKTLLYPSRVWPGLVSPGVSITLSALIFGSLSGSAILVIYFFCSIQFSGAVDSDTMALDCSSDLTSIFPLNMHNHYQHLKTDLLNEVLNIDNKTLNKVMSCLQNKSLLKKEKQLSQKPCQKYL